MAKSNPIIFLILVSAVIISSCGEGKNQNNVKNNEKFSENSFSYKEVIKNGEFSICICTENYKDTALNQLYLPNDTTDLVEKQTLFFMKGYDTLKKLSINSRFDTIYDNNQSKTWIIQKNKVFFIAVVQGQNDFFYYITGGEGCVSGCPEYYSFFSKEGSMLWESYLTQTGDIHRTLKTYVIDSSIYNPNSIEIVQVYPCNKVGRRLKASLIRGY